MTAKWTVLALLAAAPAFSQNTIQLTYDSYDSTDSSFDTGWFCSPTKPSTVTTNATGFSFPVNWSCQNGDATVTGSVTVSFSPVTVTATKTGTWGTLNFSPPLRISATATISGTGVTGVKLTGMSGFPSPKGLLEEGAAGCAPSSSNGPGTVTLKCDVTTAGGMNDVQNLMPAFGVELDVITVDHTGTTPWSSGVKAYSKFKQCSGNSCPGDKIAFTTVFPDNTQPLITTNLGGLTPPFMAQVIWDLESSPKGEVSLQLVGSTVNHVDYVLGNSSTPLQADGGGGLGILKIDPFNPSVILGRNDIATYFLQAILSDPTTGKTLALSDQYQYQSDDVSGNVQLGCSYIGDASKFIPDPSVSHPVVFLQEGLPAANQWCANAGQDPHMHPALKIHYQSGTDGTLKVSSLDNPDIEQPAVHTDTAGADVVVFPEPKAGTASFIGLNYNVWFLSDTGQKVKLGDTITIPVQYIHLVGVPAIVPPLLQSQKSSLTYNLEINARESGLRIYRSFMRLVNFQMVGNSVPLGLSQQSNQLDYTPDSASIRLQYGLQPTLSPDPNRQWAGYAPSIELPAAPALLSIASSAAGSTVTGPRSTLDNVRSTGPRNTNAGVQNQALDVVIAGLIQGRGPLSGLAVKSAPPQGDALEAAVPRVSQAGGAVTDYIPIQSTWEFNPAIPSDGSFSANITFQYQAADLPNDPNFSEAAMQAISYDPASGQIVSYPTTVDTVAKTAKIAITGLAPYYSLAVLRAPALKTLALPLFGTPSTWNPFTALVNTGSLAANLQLTTNDSDGTQDATLSPNTLSLAAGAQKTGAAPQLLPASSPAASSLLVKSDQPGVAAAQVLSQGKSLEFAAPIATVSPALVFSDVESNSLFTTNFTLVNSSTAVNSVNLYLMGPDGTQVDSASAGIPPLGSFQAGAADLFAAMPIPFQGYVIVTATAGLAAFELIEGPASVAVVPAQPVAAASPGSSTLHLYSPYFTFGGGTASILHLANLSTASASLTIRLHDASGNALGQPLAQSLAAGQQVSIDVGTILGAASSTAVAGSVTVDSTSPQVVGDLNVGDAKSFLTDRAALPLASAPAPNLVLPYVANDGSIYTASVAVFNPGTSAAAVKISVFSPNGASAGSASFNVPANGRIAGALSTLVSAASGLAAGYVRIDANVPVVAAGLMQPVAGGDSAAMLALPTTGAAGSGGTTPAPKFAASASSLDFGSVSVNQVSDKAVTLQNTGTATLNIASITPPAAPFTLTAPATPFSIAVGASQIITVRFAPTAAGSQSGSVKIATNDSSASLFTLALTGQATSAGSGVKPAFPANGVVNAASYTTSLARCSIASIFGTNLANSTAYAVSLPLPTILGGVQVMVGGVPAPLYVVTPLQINFQVPCEMPLTGSSTITVNNNGAASAPQSVTLAPYAPGVFYRSSATVDADIIHVDNSWVSQSSPAKAGEILIVWATGIGNLSQLAATGAGSPGSPPAQAVDLPAVTVGGAATVVQFAGLTPGSVGLVQINIQLPPTLPAGTSLPLVVTFPGGAASPPVSLWVQSSATGPVRGAVLVSDSFNRPDASACSLGRADLAQGGSGSHYYLPVFPASAGVYPVGLVSKALQNLGLNYSGVQLTAASGCGGAHGETIAQDLDIAVDLLVPASSAGVVQAGPYFRARAAASGDGIIGAGGYWVALTSTGQVMIRGLSPNATIATTAAPASFNATIFHTLEMVAQGSSLTVYLDNARLTFTQNNASVTTVTLPATTGENDGAVGIAFGDEANAGKAGGQRAQNLIIAQPGGH